MRPLSVFLGFLCLAGGGCASSLGGSRGPSTDYDAMSCVELNAAMGDAAGQMSRIAISRGKTDRLNIPRWVVGGSKVVSVVNDRRTARIEALRDQETAIAAARKRKC